MGYRMQTERRYYAKKMKIGSTKKDMILFLMSSMRSFRLLNSLLSHLDRLLSWHIKKELSLVRSFSKYIDNLIDYH